MPLSAAAKPAKSDRSQLIAGLLASAMQFVPRERGEAMIRKWVTRPALEQVSDSRLLAMMADAVLLSADLLLSQPAAASGTTALDRLARSRAHAPAAEAAALAALRGARFRLLQFEGGAARNEVRAHDVLSGEAVRVVGADLPPLAAGTALFGRLATLDSGLCCPAGVITPLDQAAFATATSHPAAGDVGVTAGARWAEAVYGHVVRFGTLDIPGLNRPAEDDEDDLLDAGDARLMDLLTEWSVLGDDVADAALIQRTRHLADLPTILDALAALGLEDAGNSSIGTALKRLLLVQMETVLHRERSGSGTLTLGAIGQALNEAIAAGHAPAASRALFAGLRQRVAGPAANPTRHTANDPAFERLLQRIQGLRAKTVAQGCTEQEALSAAEKVAELLDRHGLSLGELAFRAQPCEGVGIQTNRRRFAPIDSCIPGIAAYFDCRVWAEKPKGAPVRYIFFGLRGDVMAAQYLYEMVERAFETETGAFRAGTLYAEMAGERRSASHSFQVGLARGIAGKLDAMRTARTDMRRSASGRDLVPVKAAMVDDEMAKLGLDLRRRDVSRSRSVLTDAFAAGEAAGERFEVVGAVTRAA